MKNTTQASLRRQSAAMATSRATWLEIGAVVLLISVSTLSSLGCSLFLGGEYQKLAEQRRHAHYESQTAFETMLLERMFARLAFVPIVLVVMWRSGKGWASYGLVKPEFAKDILIGLGLWITIALFRLLVDVAFVIRPHPSTFFYPVAIPWHRAILLFGGCCMIGFWEELTCRAYLIPRLEAVTGTWQSVVLSVGLFGFEHLYQGDIGVFGSVVVGSVLSIGFCLTRRVWPVAIAHAIFDFIIYTHTSSHVGL